jgi:hypothetical protein
LHTAEIALVRGPTDSALRDLRKLTQQMDGRNLKYFSLVSSIDASEATIERKDYAEAQRELTADLSKSEKLGSRYQSVRINYLLAKALRLSGNSADAAAHYAQAISFLDDMRKEPGAEKLLDRADLKSLFAEASRFAHTQN